ncbi:uncharacterized protein N7498_004938 [Penicillium cinerascens]|uniref:DUF2423 domain-containing protein n=1 Tax=Penicillium cinerascens TaxID=70096 RepID=A0A9W9MMG8_9EURO|nr:uncharacterized protein N7498_004938 [Penicillium cinerascens]KAJ5204059.1 hypothetical protein N7498_004938 [Penicillium cinerascens]
MAKSIRASVSKRNRANLRKKIAGPVVDARTERLAAKLQELASQPKPQPPVKSEREMGTDDGMCAAILRQDLDSDEWPVTIADQNHSDDKATAAGEEMDVDTKISKSQKKPARVQKQNRKTRSSIVFQSHSKANKGSKRK